MLTPSPTIDGTPKVGSTLTADPGTWGPGATFTYQWLADGQAIDGATTATLQLSATQYGTRISVQVTGSRTGYEPVMTASNLTAQVAAADLSSTPVPTITGDVRVGASVSVTTGTWDDGTTLHYQWFRSGVAITGAKSATYDVVPADYGSTLTVSVTGSKYGYSTVTSTSAAAPVLAGLQTLRPTPVITGKAKVGRTLGVRATYDSGVKLSYAWFAGGKAVGKGKSTLTIGKKLKGKRIWVTVTATKKGYTDVVGTSAKTAKVKKK